MGELYNPPEFLEVIDRLSPTKLPWEGQYWSIGDWAKRRYVSVVKTNRNEQEEIKIFSTFVAALLQVAGTRGKYGQRIQLMNENFPDFSDITQEKASEVLKENGYPWLKRGINVILEAKNVILEAREELQATSFPWELYFQQAEGKFEGGFDADPFLKIKGVGRKVRDFALAQFSLHYCAIDRHITDILVRTGLVIHGYGDPDIGTNPSDEGNYKFMQRLIIQFAKATGWIPKSLQGWSPGEIDSSLWFFGQGICKGKPECSTCPISNLCLTIRNKAVNVQNI